MYLLKSRNTLPTVAALVSTDWCRPLMSSLCQIMIEYVIVYLVLVRGFQVVGIIQL